MLIRANKCKLELETLYRRSAIIINYYNFYVDGAIDVLLMSVHAGDRKGGAIDVFRQILNYSYRSTINLT